MKSIKQNKKSRKPIYIAIIVVTLLLAIGAAAFAYYETTSENSDSSMTPEAAPETLSDEDAKAKQDFIEQSQPNDTGTKSDQPVRTGGDKPNSANVSMDVSQQSSRIVVQTKIQGITDGTCTLTIKNADKIISEEAEIMFQPQYSTCAGFSIQASDLGPGTWELTLTAASGDIKGATSKTFEVN